MPDPTSVFAQPSLGASPLASTSGPTGLTPAAVRQAYGMNQVTFGNGTVAGDGRGQTIAIVVAYDNPNIGSDLRQFDRQFGLADPPSFVKYVQAGLTQSDPGWSLETALDVEWSHAMAPGANIVLVEAKSASLYDLFGAVNFAKSLSGVVAVSMSWGTGEFYGENAFDSLFTTPAGHTGGSGLAGGVSFVAASGDSGAWSGVSYPSTSSNVLSVGATTLSTAGSGYAGESGWSGSTGGFSALEGTPSYQSSALSAARLNYGLRTTPDVSMVGDPSTGVSVYSSVSDGGQAGWFTVGGTSASAPQWAGLIAVADQGLALAGKGSMANVQAAVYAIPASAFRDVTTGNNGYRAGSGYDLVTGLGTPIANRVVAGLLATQGVYNVTGFPAPAVATPFAGRAPDRFHLSFGPSVTVGGTEGSSSANPGSKGTELFPVFPPNIVVVVVQIGGTQVLVFLPTVPPESSLFASPNHPLQTEVTTPTITSLSLPVPSVFMRFGQTAAIDSLLARPARFGEEDSLAAMIDVVEPFRAPTPAEGPGAAAAALERVSSHRGTSGRLIGAMPPLGAIEHGDADRSPALVGLAALRRSLRLIRPDTVREESREEPASTVPLATAAVLAGGGCWLAWRGSARELESRAMLRPVRSFRPRIRRLSVPTW